MKLFSLIHGHSELTMYCCCWYETDQGC